VAAAAAGGSGRAHRPSWQQDCWQMVCQPLVPPPRTLASHAQHCPGPPPCRPPHHGGPPRPPAAGASPRNASRSARRAARWSRWARCVLRLCPPAPSPGSQRTSASDAASASRCGVVVGQQGVVMVGAVCAVGAPGGCSKCRRLLEPEPADGAAAHEQRRSTSRGSGGAVGSLFADPPGTDSACVFVTECRSAPLTQS
jgi:hypothetical protein